MVGSGTKMQSWVHIADMLGTLNWIARCHSGQGDAAPICNVTVPGRCSQAEFVRIAARVLHWPTLLRLPGALFRLALGEQSALLLGGAEGRRSECRRDWSDQWRSRFAKRRSSFCVEFPSRPGARSE